MQQGQQRKVGTALEKFIEEHNHKALASVKMLDHRVVKEFCKLYIQHFGLQKCSCQDQKRSLCEVVLKKVNFQL